MSNTAKSYYAIGLMSGSSLDGLDISYCKYTYQDQQDAWRFNLRASKTAELGLWSDKLSQAINLSNKELTELSQSFARYMAKEVNTFIRESALEEIDLLVSHGHTIFHYPDKGITCQIGDGQVLANNTGLKVVNNLRQKDMDYGGQGAPIVPIGDKYLFANHALCLNIGGIANISVKLADRVLAFDLCPANQVLNYYAKRLGQAFDDKGQWAREGELNSRLFDELNKLSYYQQAHPKSLDNSFSKELIVLMDSFEQNEKNALSTFTEHLVFQLVNNLKNLTKSLGVSPFVDTSLLITGGGAFNAFLVERIKEELELSVVIPPSDIINYKEAIVMGFIGVLRLRSETNVLASVTGAYRDSSCGDVYLPHSQKLL